MITNCKLNIDQPVGVSIDDSLVFMGWLDRVIKSVVEYCGFDEPELVIAADKDDTGYFLFAMQNDGEIEEEEEFIARLEKENPVLGFWREARPGGAERQ